MPSLTAMPARGPYTTGHGGKPWSYALIPHDEIAVNMTLEALAKRCAG